MATEYLGVKQVAERLGITSGGLLFAINATATAAMGASAAPNPERNSPMALSSSAICSMFTSFPWLTYL